MKRRSYWFIGFGIALLTLSLVLLAAHYLIFQDLHWLEEYIVFDLAFLPIEVIVVTLILDRLLEARERKERLEKMNMVIGLFFSEVGTVLLRDVAGRDRKIAGIRARFAGVGDLAPADYARLKSSLKEYPYSPDLGPEDFARLKGLLTAHRGFLVRLLENPILLEHESLTDALRAVFHLTEELDYRGAFADLPAPDVAHLTADVSRAYGRLIVEWMDYMRYLKAHYPYLYSLAMRTNPFDAQASPVIRA